MFEAPYEAQLEIHTGMMASAILSDTIPCERLVVSPAQQAPWQSQLSQSFESAKPVAIPASA